MLRWLYFKLRKAWYARLGKAKGWKRTALDFWKWDKPGTQKQLIAMICPNCTEAQFEAYDSSTIWQLKPKLTDVCLNIGCGIGRVERFLGPKVREVHAVDMSEPMINMARHINGDLPNVIYYINDGCTLDMFGDGYFDIAFAELVFQHVPPEVVKSYAREVYRVLKPGGRFICQIPTLDKYGHMPRELCAYMTRAEVDDLFSMFSKVDYDSGCTNEWYHAPIVTK